MHVRHPQIGKVEVSSSLRWMHGVDQPFDRQNELLLLAALLLIVLLHPARVLMMHGVDQPLNVRVNVSSSLLHCC
jgi:hypothetical protein